MNTRRPQHPGVPLGNLAELLPRKVLGQPSALQDVVLDVRMYRMSQGGLSPPDRPAGMFLLLGPTGPGKTRTIEALAEILHGSLSLRASRRRCAEPPDPARAASAEERGRP